MANKEYNFQYTPLTGRLPGNSFVKQTEQAINELAGIVNEGSAQVEVITNLANTANENSEEALEKANEALETAGRVYITLPNLDNADNYFDSELYYFANSYSTNLPVQDTGFLEVKTNDTKTACEQVFIADSTGLCYFRHGVITSTEVGDETVYSVTWETWSSALASEDYVQGELTNYLPLTGGTVTGSVEVTGGVTADITGNVTGNADTATNATNATNDSNGNQIDTTYLPLSGGTLTGNVNGVTPTAGDDSTKLATTEFVQDEISAINTRLGTIYTASGSFVTAGGVYDVCSISTHPAGVFLITGHTGNSIDVTSGTMVNYIYKGSTLLRSCVTPCENGGGAVNVIIASLTENEVVTLKGFKPSTLGGTYSGTLTMVQLA